MSGEGGPIPQIKWHTGHAITREGEVVDWVPGETRHFDWDEQPDTIYWYPPAPGSLFSGERFDIVWGEGLIYLSQDHPYSRWRRLKWWVSGWYNYFDAILPCEIGHWIARKLQRYADHLYDRHWYL